MDNSRLQSQDDASYTLVSPTLPYLKGVAKLKNLQDEVSYVLVCAAEAWWYPKIQEEALLDGEHMRKRELWPSD